jgi:hypothetical protein
MPLGTSLITSAPILSSFAGSTWALLEGVLSGLRSVRILSSLREFDESVVTFCSREFEESVYVFEGNED